MNTTQSVFGESPEEEIVSETVFDTKPDSEFRRGRGRPRKVQPDEDLIHEVKQPVDVGTLSDILNRNKAYGISEHSTQSNREYKVVMDSKVALFEEKVVDLLKAGWSLLGTTFNYNGMLAQTLIR